MEKELQAYKVVGVDINHLSVASPDKSNLFPVKLEALNPLEYTRENYKQWCFAFEQVYDRDEVGFDITTYGSEPMLGVFTTIKRLEQSPDLIKQLVSDTNDRFAKIMETGSGFDAYKERAAAIDFD